MPLIRASGVDYTQVARIEATRETTSCNTNAPTIMIAEKAADMILA